MRLIRLVHAWAGAIVSLVLIVLGLSGALLVWKDDYLRATIPEARQSVALDPGALAAIAQEAQADHPDSPPRSIVFASEDLGVHTLALRDDAGAYLSGAGQTLARWTGTERFELWVFDLHHYLLAGETGMTVAGVSGIAAFLLSLTGLIIAWPALRLFGARLVPVGVKRRDLIGAHRDLGLMIALPILIATATGSMLVFNDLARPAFQALAPGPPTPKPPVAGIGTVNWQRAMAEAKARFPDARIRIAIWPSAVGKPATIRLRQSGEWHTNGRTIVWIDPATSTVIGEVDAQASSPGDRAWNAVWPLHAAKVSDGPVAARAVDALTSLTGLGLALLGAYGLWAFALKHSSKRRSRSGSRPAHAHPPARQ
jgi:uncharacterized iron-regulated membrane protein